jgi:MFS family permease
MILSIGMLFWILRYILFANAGPDAQALVFLGVLFHGICYDFFFFAGQLYIDKRAPDDIRSAAQGFIAFVTLGIGMFIGGLLNGWWVLKQKLEDGSTDWSSVWYFPAIMAGVVLFLFLLTFRDSKNTTQESTA